MNNWPSAETGLLSRTKTPAWIMTVVTALYGALHALCWHSHFPSLAETMLWRTSSIIIAGGLATATVLYSGFYYVDDRLPIGMRDKI